MATPSLASPSPSSLNKGSMCFVGGSSSPPFSPSSDNRFWSTLRGRVETLLENRGSLAQSLRSQPNAGEADRGKRLKEDSLLLLRGFDSVAHSLSRLSDNIENALQGARDLAKPPTLNEVIQRTLENAKNNEEEVKTEGEGSEVRNRGLKRKLDGEHEEEGGDSQAEDEQRKKDWGKLNKAKNLAISMASKASTLARQLKSIKSELLFTQDRCALLEEENRRLRDGFSEGFRPEEDDLVRLQLEALLAEKSRLANENANLTRENQCLRQLVEYHQLTSQDLSASYESLVRGMCLDFSSPSPSSLPEGDDEDEDVALKTPRSSLFGFSNPLEEEELSGEGMQRQQ